MRVAFHLESRLALGRRLPEIVDACRSTPLLAPQAVLLTSRQRREDLPLEEVFRSAAASQSDSAEIGTSGGSVGAHWLYGPRRSVPRVWGAVALAKSDVQDLVGGFKRLCVAAGATYGLADLDSLLAERATKPDVYQVDGAVHAFRTLHWLNYFGPDFQPLLPVTNEVSALARVDETEGGGVFLMTRESPEGPIPVEALQGLARAWPVFRDYEPKAGFPAPVHIDYSEVWGGAAPSLPEPRPPGALVGPPDEFIAAVAAHARRFHEWADGKGLSVRDEAEFRRVLQEHERIIRDELLVPAIAAFGEMVRARTGGVWKKSRILHRGEPMVMKPGQPWTARRVVLEVLEGLEPIEL